MTPIGSGDLFVVGPAASVQFVRPIMFRVIRVLDLITYDRWTWLEGYELDNKGQAVRRRQIFVQPAGLRKVNERPAPATSQTVRAVRQSR